MKTRDNIYLSARRTLYKCIDKLKRTLRGTEMQGDQYIHTDTRSNIFPQYTIGGNALWAPMIHWAVLYSSITAYTSGCGGCYMHDTELS